MAATVYFPQETAAWYRSQLNALRLGSVIKPERVDIHGTGCNARCRNCIGHSGVGKGNITKHISKWNIGQIIDNVVAGYDNDDMPHIHFAGFTSDPFFEKLGNADSSIGLNNSAVEGFLHLIRKGLDLAKKVSFVTNGIGLPRSDNHPHSFAELLRFAESLQVSIDASCAQQYREYKRVDRFNLVMDNIRELAYWGKHSGSVDFKGVFKQFGIPVFEETEILADRLPPFRLKVNYVLHRRNQDIKDGFIEKLEKYGVDELCFRTDYFLRGDRDFQYRMQEMVASLQEKYEGANMAIILKSPDNPITVGSFNRCATPFFWPAVGADGNVYPCAHTVIPGFAIGSLFERTLLEILLDYYGKYASGDTSDKKCRMLCPSWVGRINLLQCNN